MLVLHGGWRRRLDARRAEECRRVILHYNRDKSHRTEHDTRVRQPARYIFKVRHGRIRLARTRVKASCGVARLDWMAAARQGVKVPVHETVGSVRRLFY